MSFYYTHKVALYVRSTNPIMITLKEKTKDLEVSYIDSTIIDDLYIIPGLNGKKINLNASLSKMNDTFDESKIVYYSVSPKISLEENKNKIIIRGNDHKDSVSLIFPNITTISKYLVNNKYQINLLITEEKYNKSYELINYSNHESTYKNIDKFLKKNKLNRNICLTKNNSIPSLCKNKYIIKPSMIITQSNFSNNMNKIESGEIILIESINSEQLTLLLKHLSSKRLNIVYLSELIKE